MLQTFEEMCADESESGGVDNWEWYSESLIQYYSDED